MRCVCPSYRRYFIKFMHFSWCVFLVLGGWGVAISNAALPFKVDVLEHAASSASSSNMSKDVETSINRLISQLSNNSVVSTSGVDGVVRPTYVMLQGLIEKALVDILERQSGYRVMAIFHTPAPPTPFCLGSENPSSLMHGSIKGNQGSITTVISRQKTTLDMLENGVLVENIFPESGLSKRTESQLKNYEKIKSRFPKNFFDIKVRDDMASNQVGATYLIQTPKGGWYIFAIRASQANAPKRQHDSWVMVLGALSDNAVKVFYENTIDYLSLITGGQINNVLRQTFPSGVDQVVSKR